jgi:hypothetical protein
LERRGDPGARTVPGEHRGLAEPGRVQQEGDTAVGGDGGAGVRPDTLEERAQWLHDDLFLVQDLPDRTREQAAASAQGEDRHP